MANNPHQQNIVVIAGGGPAGLTAAYEIASRTDKLRPVLFEASDMLGGISRTVNHHGNRMDIGGHRFFSKEKRVTDRWEEIMPMQSSPAIDEILLGEKPQDAHPATDPERADRVMLRRRRISRIYYLRKFFDYPVSLSVKTLKAMGLWRTLKAGTGFLATKFHRLPDDSLENFYINRFGRPLYNMFFEDYTEKVWGIHPSRLGADWGSQRVKGLSLTAIVRDMFMKKLGLKGKGKVETSLIEEFIYPKHGPGQLWELTGEAAQAKGAEVVMNTTVEKVHIGADRRVEAVTVKHRDGRSERLACEWFVSSMPLRDLVAAIEGIDIPEEVRNIAAELPYRDFITVGLLVPRLKIKNSTKLRTVKDRIPDTWIYVQEREVKLGRIQVFNNWSPYMVADFEDTVWIGLEYFCTEGDEMWQMDDATFIDLAKRELESIGIINAADVMDAVRIKVKKAYPSYFGAYYQLDKVRSFLDTIPNLYCVGRNGQHRYNNMDHSMLTAMIAADKILAGDTDKSAVWNVNTDTDYHETKQS
ncbi:MAG: NAD(P)/FAD-dependent oxidoreductase [Candidatus Amulumruptor caecigallinarius]|nr:NAD(P)/FAD-dependent oxidoreductase [Candidatus Amulumruptor caecigallinarius]MCM1396333.1 NAD(P)/FAD-dependent oxidoreductase [Candidatus Amulumruptor caecigallinarius]MCM1453725.1 NAD(P)/FAD-dependent oxidoreductase [bacterium]